MMMIRRERTKLDKYRRRGAPDLTTQTERTEACPPHSKPAFFFTCVCFHALQEREWVRTRHVSMDAYETITIKEETEGGGRST